MIYYLLGILLIGLIIFFSLEFYYHQNFKTKMAEDLPKNYMAIIKEDIELPQIEKSNIVPKKLFRTYYDLELAKKFTKAKIKTKESLGDFEEYIFDDDMIEKYIKENYSSRIYNAYMSINKDYGPAKADFFRYLIIYKEGGIYLDVKSAIVENIEEELSWGKLIISRGKINPYPFRYGFVNQIMNNYNWSDFSGVKYYGEYNNWCIISPPGSEILGKVIKQVVSNIEYGLQNKNKYNNGEYSVLALTGPIMFSRVIIEYGNKENIIISPNDLNDKVRYSLKDIDHKKIGYKKHYSKVENKNILNVTI